MSATASRSRISEALLRAEAPAAEHVFTLRLDDEARAFAEAVDAARQARSRAPYLGTPVTVKDNFDLAGYPTTAGSTILRDAPIAKADAPVVTRLRNAGCILVGRTNMTEFAFSGLGLNPHYGTPLNPAFPGERRIPGGSSSGAAVAVASGIAPVAIGTDTGGSIRIPAAFCGLTGFKPTANMVSREGVLPLSETLDSVGVIAKCVASCAAFFDVIRDLPGARRTAWPAQRIRLGLVTNYVTQDVSDEVGEAVARSVAILEHAGVSIERLEIPELDAIPDMMREASFAAAEAYAWHEPLLEAGLGPGYDPRVLIRIEAGKSMLLPPYRRLHDRRRALIETVSERMVGVDALVWPTVPFVAPTVESLVSDDAYHAANGLALRNSTVVNLIDGCAISIPCPTERAPVGLTLASSSGRDDMLLSVATTVQSLFKGV